MGPRGLRVLLTGLFEHCRCGDRLDDSCQVHKGAKMTKQELKAIIRCIHRIYYEQDIMNNPLDALEFHKHLSVLFDFAGITSSLSENNPDKMSPEAFEQLVKTGLL